MNERDITLSKLKAVVNEAKGIKTDIEKIPDTVQEAKENIETVNEVVNENIEAVQTTEQHEEINLFNTVAESTEEDFNLNQNERGGKVQEIAENLNSSVDDEDISEDDDSPQVKKELANIKATGIVEIVDLIICVICMAISGDWSKDAQERKYTLTAARKKVLVVNIMRIIIAKKKKTSPTGAIVGVALASFIPMIALAIMERRNKKQKEKEEKEALRREQIMFEREQQLMLREQQLNRVYTPVNNTGTLNNIQTTKRSLKPIKPIKTGVKGKQGRHKKNCAYYNGKPCNCK